MAKYVNEFEVAKITGLAVQTLRNWRFQRRGFPYFKISPRSIRYSLEDIQIYMKDHKITPEDGDERVVNRIDPEDGKK